MAEIYPSRVGANYFAGAAQAEDQKMRKTQNALAQQELQHNALRAHESQHQLNDEQKRQFATRLVQAAQYAIQMPDSKAFVEQNYPQLAQLAGPTWATADDATVKQKLTEAIGIFGPQAGIGPAAPPREQDFTLSPGQTRYGPDGKPIASVAPTPREEAPVNSQIITRPVGNGLVQDFSRDPRTGRRIPEGEPYRPVTPHTGNVTEGERKAAALGTRLESSLRELSQISATDQKPGVIERGFEGMGAEMAANAVRSTERQQAKSAQLDALDAALTLATGAAYTKEQLNNLWYSYFPQIGDSDKTVEFKKNKFETIVRTARIAAGRAEPSIDAAVGPQNQPPQQEVTATGPNGQKIVLRNGQWVPK